MRGGARRSPPKSRPALARPAPSTAVEKQDFAGPMANLGGNDESRRKSLRSPEGRVRLKNQLGFEFEDLAQVLIVRWQGLSGWRPACRPARLCFESTFWL